MTTTSEIIRDALYTTLDSRTADLFLAERPDTAADIAIAIGHARVLAGCTEWLDSEMRRIREMSRALAEKVTT